jgi:hypothetical protein
MILNENKIVNLIVHMILSFRHVPILLAFVSNKYLAHQVEVEITHLFLNQSFRIMLQQYRITLLCRASILVINRF